ncbi:MAG: glycoside hydrolase family 3 C-terminal domain-containing protein [Ilumatobacteraceae bacterium]
MIDIDAALTALSLEDKCRLLAGKTTWRTKAFPHAGIPEVKMSDGPNGVRGEGHGGSSTPGVVVPSGITLGASWDPQLLGEIGELLGTEARRKGAHILLGPTVNIHRTPVGGRTFECYSEDPELSGILAAAYVRGVQSKDVAVTVKHFVCNDTEMDRMTVDVQVDDRPLREIYLRPFERAVKEGGAWGIMSAYNRLGGEHCAENHRLLTDILRDEWGFDGFVVSDWFGVHHTVEAANAGLDIEMPAPVRVYGTKLVEAVKAGEVDEPQVDRLVLDVLSMINRVRADEFVATADEQSVDDPAERALTRRAAIGGTVLLRNDAVSGRPVLPFDPGSITSIAVVGPNAVTNQCMGGGSASLTPFDHRTLLAALTDRLGPGSSTDATVTFEPGVRTDRLTPVVRGDQLRRADGEPGLRLEYMNGRTWDSDVVVEDVSPSSLVRFFGSIPAGVDPRAFAVRITGEFIPDTDGAHQVGVVSTGPVTVTAGTDASVIVDDPEAQLPRSQEFFGYGSIEVVETIECTAGVPVPLHILWRTVAENGFAAIRVGIRSPEPADLMERAVAAAAAADVAVVMVGTNDEWETEGFDRTTMDLPGRQDELVRRVCAANPRTAVIVNAGSPVTMDWATGDDGAPAVLTSFFAGQEQAEALVDVLLGVADPGGRLPLTIPMRLDDHPARENEGTTEGMYGKPVQRYEEGLDVGYRGYEHRGIAPRFAFGHGLSYGAASWGAPTADRTTVSAADPAVTVTVPITASGDRPATVVVQGYVAAIDPKVERPAKELRAFAKVVVDPGAQPDTTETVATLTFDDRSFARWDTPGAEWVVDPGDYDLVIAASATDERSRLRITVT